MKTLRKVVVLYGGWSHETPHVITFNDICNSLNKLEIDYKLISVNDKDFINELICYNPDSVFITNQGAYGEDGKIQGLLELIDLNYTGSGSYACAVGMNKFYSKLIFESLGIKTPKYIFKKKKDSYPNYETVVNKFGSPFIIKPNLSGCSFGVNLVYTEFFYKECLNEIIENFGDYLIEEFIDGNKIEYSTGVLEDYDKIYELPICQSKFESAIFSSETKFQNKNIKIIDPDIPETLKKKMVSIAKRIHFEVGCSGYSRTDMILKGDDIYVLEFNTAPGLLINSIFPKICNSINLQYVDVIKIILNNSLKKKEFEIEKLKAII